MTLRIKLFRYTYSLRINRRYCGAVAMANRVQEGETWRRGRDLRDGTLWRLPLVLWDIVRYEFLTL